MFTKVWNMNTVCRSAILMAMCLCGCDDNLLNSPAGSPGPVRPLPDSPVIANVSTAATPESESGSLLLAGILKIPGTSLVARAAINGEVLYSIARIPYRGAFRINIDLATTATLSPEGGETALWHAAGKSSDRFFLVQGGSVLLEKDYLVKGSSHPLYLHLTFIATPNGVDLKSMALEPADISLADG